VSISESLYVALFMISIVFFALFALYFCVRLFSYVVMRVTAAKAGKPSSQEEPSAQ